MENKKSANVGLIVLFVFLFTALGILGGYLIFNIIGNEDKVPEVNNGNDEFESSDNNGQLIDNQTSEKREFMKTVKEKLNIKDEYYFENLSKEAYGYVIIRSKNREQLFELRRDSEKKLIADCQGCMLRDFEIVNNNLIFEVSKAEYEKSKYYVKIISVDLNNLSSKLIMEDYSSFNKPDFSSITDDYLFSSFGENGGSSNNKLYRYDLKNEKIDVIDLLSSELNGLLSYGDRLYAYYDKLDEELELYYKRYFKMDFNGKHFEEISEESYEKVKKELGINDFPSHRGEHIYYNNVKISLSDDYKQLFVGDNKVYSAPNDKQLEFVCDSNYGNNKNNIIVFEYKFDGGEFKDPKYYWFNVNENKIIEIDERNISKSVCVTLFLK